jgi:DNA adenine methylase
MQLAEAILARLPEPIVGTYYEPFVGGGAVFFELRRRARIGAAKLFDANAELVDCYCAVRDEPEAVLAALAEHRNDEAHYYEVRALDPASLGRAERAARTIFLNRVGFNGLYRVNSKGQFNVPFGRYERPRLLDREGILAASNALAGVSIEVSDFEAAVANAGAGDVVYFDPPYVPVSATSSFTRYAKDDFGPADQERLAQCFRRLVERDAYVLLSNSDTDAARELYRGFKVNALLASRRINSKADRRGAVGEILVQGLRAAGRRASK